MLLFFSNSDIIPCGVNCLVKIVWDWNGTLLNDVDLCFSCINRLLVSHDLKPLDTLSQYREVFTFPIEDYYKRVGFDFDKIPFSIKKSVMSSRPTRPLPSRNGCVVSNW